MGALRHTRSNRLDDVVRRCFQVLSARYDERGTRDDWSVTGKDAMINVQRLKPADDVKFQKLMRAYWDHTHYPAVFDRIDFAAKWHKVWTIQRTLNPRHFMWLLGHYNEWNQWKVSRRLPCYVLWKRRIVIWNGTHRAIIGYVLRKPVHGRIVDLDRYIRDRKAGKVE